MPVDCSRATHVPTDEELSDLMTELVDEAGDYFVITATPPDEEGRRVRMSPTLSVTFDSGAFLDKLRERVRVKWGILWTAD